MPSISILFIVDTIWQRSIIISLDYKIGLCILDAPIRQQKMEKTPNFYRRIQDISELQLHWKIGIMSLRMTDTSPVSPSQHWQTKTT